FKVAVDVRLPSLAWRVKVAFVAVQLAMMSAVTFPAVLTIFDSVTPLDGFALVTVTVTLAAPVSASATVAICEFETGEPSCRVTPDCAVIVGAVFTTAGMQAPRRIVALLVETLAVAKSRLVS